MSEISESNKGIPIFLDEQVRGVVDSLEVSENDTDWFPSNAASLKLWHCLESLRDIDLVLEEALNQKNATKKKRQLKQFSVHLFTLASAISQLCDQIVGNKSIHGSLTEETMKEVANIKNQFLELVPIDWKGDLAQLRNKLGAHIDSKVWPWQAQELMKRTTVSMFGRWLHVCLHVILDLTKLDIYSWSCHSEQKDLVRLMTNEPFLVTFHMENDKPNAIVAVHIATRSPRETIVDYVNSIIANSQWMFDSSERRIHGLTIDKGNKWNTFVQGNAIWKEP